jgi:hypothetical protein
MLSHMPRRTISWSGVRFRGERMTIFGQIAADTKPRLRGSPRHLG